MRIGSLFTGTGALDMAVEHVTGGRTVWRCDNDPGAAKIIDAHWPGETNLGDVTKVDWATVEPVDVLVGSFPCQDVSVAGKRGGLIRYGTANRSGLWAQMARAVDVLRPHLVVVENVRGLLSAKADTDLDLLDCHGCLADAGANPVRALGAVLGDLAGLGYDAAWRGVRASDIGACHQRFRVFAIAWPATDAVCAGLARWVERPAGEQRREGPAALGGGDRLGGPTDWGIYEPAIRRQESLTRLAPAPTETGPRGGQRLSPRFEEWMMGLPDGWVTGNGLSRKQEMKILGNGVVVEQAEFALTHLLNAVAVAE